MTDKPYKPNPRPFSKRQEIGYFKIIALSEKYKVALDFNRCMTCNNRDYGSVVKRTATTIMRDYECNVCGRRVISKETIRVIKKGKYEPTR